MAKLTDAEIIKALDDIVYIYSKDATTINGMRVVTLFENVLDLINRQKAEIERKTKHIAEIVDEYAKFKEAAKRQEIARIRNIEQVADEEINRLQAENERLQSDNVKLHTIIPKMLVEAKSEAIKEFAERLKEKKDGGTYPYVLVNVIDNIVKEMVGKSFTKIEHDSLCETETYKTRKG